MPSIQDRQWHCLVRQRKQEQYLFRMTLSMKGLCIWSVMTHSTVARRPLLIHLNSLSCVPAWHEIKPKWRPPPRCLLASLFYKDRPQNLKLRWGTAPFQRHSQHSPVHLAVWIGKFNWQRLWISITETSEFALKLVFLKTPYMLTAWAEFHRPSEPMIVTDADQEGKLTLGCWNWWLFLHVNRRWAYLAYQGQNLNTKLIPFERISIECLNINHAYHISAIGGFWFSGRTIYLSSLTTLKIIWHLVKFYSEKCIRYLWVKSWRDASGLSSNPSFQARREDDWTVVTPIPSYEGQSNRWSLAQTTCSSNQCWECLVFKLLPSRVQVRMTM